MSGGARKHGAHRENLQVAFPTLGTDPSPAIYVYDAYSEGGAGTVNSPTGGYDLYQEAVIEMSLTLSAALTGQATNFTTFAIVHADSAANTKNLLTLAASTTAYVFAAKIPANLAVASGATIPGAGTATLVVTTGVALPWKLVPGDTIELLPTHTGNGQYAGGVSLNFVVAGLGA
jgi:hypothetical protein